MEFEHVDVEATLQAVRCNDLPTKLRARGIKYSVRIGAELPPGHVIGRRDRQKAVGEQHHVRLPAARRNAIGRECNRSSAVADLLLIRLATVH